MFNRITLTLTLLATTSCPLFAQVASPSVGIPLAEPIVTQVSRFPVHWGPEPKYQTFDLVPLPGGYGQGSSTLKAWIQKNLDADAARQSPQPSQPSKYPAHWPPLTGPVATDYVRLPGGYGYGSSTVAEWIRRNMAADAAREARHPERVPPSTQRYPAHWGRPPLMQSRDLVMLPGGFGKGSSTLAAWIQRNMTADIQQNVDVHQRHRPYSSPMPIIPLRPNAPAINPTSVGQPPVYLNQPAFPLAPFKQQPQS